MLPVIQSEHEYQTFLGRIDELWDAAEGSEDERELRRLAAAVQVYEQAERSKSLPPPRGGALIAYVLRERKMTQRELGRRLGWSSGRVSEVVNGKRALTLDMVRCLSTELNIDPRLLVHEATESDADHVWVRVKSDVANALLVDHGAVGVSLDDLVQRILSASTATLDVLQVEMSDEQRTDLAEMMARMNPEQSDPS
ncbi:MAG: HTH-type transcriptional regulator/antitoxin HigA [bacterium]|jgi:HTH-type transcriptional regulator/antitoxin HigA